MSDPMTTGEGPALPLPGSQMLAVRRITYAMMGVAGVLLLAGAFVLYTLHDRIMTAQTIETTKASDVGNSQQVANRYATTLADFNAANGELRFLEKPADPNDFIPTLLPQIQKLAESYGCQVTSMTPGALTSPTPAGAASAPAATTASSTDASASQPDYQIMPLTLALTGTYSQVMHFVYGLTRFPKMVTVKSISLHPNSNSSTSSAPQSKGQTVSVQLQLQAYVFPVDDYSATGTATPGTAATVARPAAPGTAGSDLVDQSINRPIKAALSVQRTSAERVTSAGLQAQPTPRTLPDNPNLGK